MERSIKITLGEAFNEMAGALETGCFNDKIKIGVTTLGSEHGIDNILAGANMAAKNSEIEIVLIGPRIENCPFETAEASTEEEAHEVMERLLDANYIQAAVTLHYNFPIGVSTVGRVISPACGKEVFIATTTGTSSTHRVEAMFKNAIYGIIAAKTCGIREPKVGILNLDGSRGVERALLELKNNGYNISFGESQREDGGAILRGNDLITGSVDVVVTDSLTGNILMKMFSSFNSGGSYETVGYGYGPGIGFDYNRAIFIISRASGSRVIAGAIQYASEAVKGNLNKTATEEYNRATLCGFEKIVQELKMKDEVAPKPIIQIEKEVVTAQISGIDIMELEAAVETLKMNGIYAESGMGCTGPIVMVSENNFKNSLEILLKSAFITKK